MGTKMNIKIIWNQMLSEEIENQIQLGKWVKIKIKIKTLVKRMKTPFEIKIKWK
jgi:hypothetical protein